MIRALVFDFDGLILETETPLFQSWQEIYQSYGCRLDLEKWLTNIGRGEDEFDAFIDLEKLLGQKLDLERLESTRQYREREILGVQPVLPGVEDYLKRGRTMGLKIGLASCSSRGWVVNHLERLELLKFFDCILTGEDVKSLKPDPELYLSTLERLKVDPHEAIAFEDSPYGIQSAKQAGMYCVAVPNPLSRLGPIDQADMYLNSLGDISLERLLQRIEA